MFYWFLISDISDCKIFLLCKPLTHRFSMSKDHKITVARLADDQSNISSYISLRKTFKVMLLDIFIMALIKLGTNTK